VLGAVGYSLFHVKKVYPSIDPKASMAELKERRGRERREKRGLVITQ
jgi:hypothetical protein